MTDSEREALAAICLQAAFADGAKQEAERKRLKAIFDDLGTGFSPTLYQRVLVGRMPPEEPAAALQTPALRTLAYEMAVGVCDADGRSTEAERAFLDRLRTALALDEPAAQEVLARGDALAEAPLREEALTATLPTTRTAGDGARPDAAPPLVSGEIDALILRYAVLNGGLELLPQSLATMAIVPLQMRMVYQVGRHHGYELDQGHVRELLATVGLGMTSQVVEGYARKLLGGAAKKSLKKALGKKMGKKAGKKAGRMAAAATGAAVTFAATYALGRAADAYYAGGRTLSTSRLRSTFEQEVARGQTLFDTYRPRIEESARQTDLTSLLTTIRSGR